MTTNIHDIPETLTHERLERVLGGEVDHIRGLTEDEYADIIFLAASVIESSEDGMKLFSLVGKLLESGVSITQLGESLSGN